MAEHEPPAERGNNPEVRHEPSDARVSAVIFFGMGLLLLALVVHIALWAQLGGYERREDAEKKSVYPLAAEEHDRLPPQPRLEGIDPVQRAVQGEPGEFREVNELNRYQWVNKEAGIVNLPVEEAMQALLQTEKRGERRTEETRMPSSANSGRELEGSRP